MGATKYKLQPPIDPEDPDEPIRFSCSDCKDLITPSNFNTHAKAHHSTSVLVDTTTYPGDKRKTSDALS